MNIGEAARASGISAKMIRHYESIGLIPNAGRSLSGYRYYDKKNIHTLRFIRRARTAGFSAEQIKKLLSLWSDQQRPAREVKQLAEQHLSHLKERINELKSMAAALSELIMHCQGDDRPDCPILESLADEDTTQEFNNSRNNSSIRRRQSLQK